MSTWPGARQQRHARVIAPRPGAADRDHRIRILGKRAFQRAHEDHVRALRRDAARNRKRRHVGPDRDDAHARLAHTHARNAHRLQRRDIDRAQPFARKPQWVIRRGIRAGREHAVAGGCRRMRLGAAPRDRTASGGKHRIGVTRQRGARIHPSGCGIERHRRIGPGIGDLLGAHGPPVDERDRRGGHGTCRDHVLRQHAAFRVGEASSRGATGCASAATRASTCAIGVRLAMRWAIIRTVCGRRRTSVKQRVAI